MLRLCLSSAGRAVLSASRRMTTTAAAADEQRFGVTAGMLAHRDLDPQQSNSVLIRTQGNSRVVLLNRPKALNALNAEMVEYLIPKYKAWNNATSSPVTVLAGVGNKAFCAGGDVVALVNDIQSKAGRLTQRFWQTEYQLNYLIGTLRTPQIALLDGITMGGGVGLSVHGAFRVATEHTVFAMPETAIGFFPDVGGSYFLPRLPGALGMFLGLTGHRLQGYDTLYARIATHFVPSHRLKALVEELETLDTVSYESVDGLIRQFEEQRGEHADLEEHRSVIDRCFNADSVESIMRKLKDDGTPFALQQLVNLEQMSPMSLKVTYRQIREGRRLSFADCLRMEYRLTQRFIEDNDFVEGVRAKLIDKPKRTPQWKPATVEEVKEADVNRYFAPLPSGQELRLVDHNDRPVTFDQ